ncbi:two-component system, OmpR family, sensor histidine kinase CpxA [Maridesulfovibrio ferrireducens]|uniref:histidine kinase n=1 Tax=Maridesulfovibrio ferrireducens TaxID=246191 RepID=A0A1G9J5V6_9BACT|nr:HAMP domain-containing sensor histidine kinase [Maridesulfovibrio ferrireducens]SDL32889.1 two-component system, OmpR family, sensor histidine kinase CpxA [Maridesulfovibrio ferrireducens]
MKISRLYLKIFLAFLLVLMVSEFTVIWIIHTGWAGSPRMKRTEGQLMAIKNLTEMEIESKHLSPGQEKEALTPLMKTLSKSFRAEVWITGPYSEVVASSGEIIPDLTLHLEGKPTKTTEGVYIYKERRKGMKSVYGTYSSNIPEGYPFTYHLFHPWKQFEEEIWFLRGQALITILAALFLLPVALRIIKPIKELTRSAAKLGQGDLTQRVKVRGKDEVAELARTFNHMAEGLEKIIKSNRELTANVSHEMRSPLARMGISLEMIREKINNDKPAQCEAFISGMQSEIIHMDTLIGKIIEFSKLDMQKVPPMNDSINLDLLITELLYQYQPTADHKKLKIISDLEDVTITDCDQNAIRIILDNILGNAFKYTEQNGVIEVELRAKKDELLMNKAVIQISNTHSPVPEEELEEIFNPFHRLKGHDTPGYGLGLAAAQKIATMHQGSMQATNTEKGFTITVTLPIAKG